HAVLPAKGILAVISLICAVIFFAGFVRPGGMFPGVALGMLVLSAVLVGGDYPALVQQFQVKPNAQARERPYRQRHIDATRTADGVDSPAVTRSSAGTEAVPSGVQGGSRSTPGTRLLGPRMLSSLFQQKQRVRGYCPCPEQL